ncbi:MAG: glycosyltransferase, partial [Nanoarchaeota archaeon]
MRTMHVLMVSEFFPPVTQGGGETSALALAKALAKNGQRVSVLTSRAEGLPEKSVTEGVLVIRTLGTGKTSNSFVGNIKRLGITASIKKELPALIDLLKPDVLHALNITSMPGVAVVARAKGIPAIAHINSPLAFDPKGTLLDGNKERVGQYTFGAFIASFTRSSIAGRLANPWYLRFNPIVWCVFYRRWSQIRDSFPRFNHFFPISKTM